MSVSNGRVTAPVGLAEVCQLVGASSLDVGAACVSEYINKWSRKKPMFIGSNVFDSPDWDSDTWKQFGFGLKPAGGDSIGRYAFSQIRNNDDWNQDEWIFSPWKNGNGPYRLLDFDGYNHLATAPFDVPGLINTTYKGNAADNVVFDIDIPINVNRGCISLADLGDNYNQFHLCMLFYCTNDGQWYVKVDPNTIGSYLKQSGTMASMRLQVTARELAGKNYKWWLCGVLNNGTWGSNFMLAPANITDTTTWFIALPSSRTNTCKGTISYEGEVPSLYRFSFAFWGINNNDYWQPTLGLNAPTTTTRFGQMLLDYNYGLQIGVTITNTGDYDYTLQYRKLSMTVSRTFDSTTPKKSYMPNLYIVTSTQTGTSLAGKYTALGSYPTGEITLARNSSINFIFDLGADFMGVMSETKTGQTIDFTVTAELDNTYSGSYTFRGTN